MFRNLDIRFVEENDMERASFWNNSEVHACRTIRLALASLFLLIGDFSDGLQAQVTVTVSPPTATLATLATQPLTATVSGTTNTAVSWQVNGVVGGNSTVGLISTTIPGTSNEGLYLGPSALPSPATISVTAVSQADPTKSASATVTLETPSRSGVTFFVSTTGNDSNAGTSSAPWRTIQHAANTVHPGDTVQVMGGVYNESVTIPGSGNATTGYITFESTPGQTAILDGTGINLAKGQQFGLFTLRTNSYIVIQGFEIRNFQSSTGNAVPVGIDFEGSGSNIEILNNRIDNIVFEGVSPNVSFDQARDGWDFENTIFNITAANNPVYHGKLGANGQYCDGCTRVIIERNLIHDSDIPIEVASEHAGHVSSFVTVRNNVIYHAQFVGISIGGFSSKVGGTDHCTIVNNSLWDDGTARGAAGELQIQYNATNNSIFNNIMYAGPTNVLINDFTSSVSSPATLDDNLYFATVGAPSSSWDWQGKFITGYSNYQAASGQDTHSPFADPQFDNIATLPPNLDVASTSPAVNGGTNLGPAVVGVLDFAGNPRVNANGQINIGAYEQ